MILIIMIIIIIITIGKHFIFLEFYIFLGKYKDIMLVGQILEVKIPMEEIGIQIRMNGKIKIMIHQINVHGIIIYHHQIIINGMEIIILIMDNQITINGSLPINPNLLLNNNNHNKINNYLILKQIQLLFTRKQVVNIIYNIINIQLHYNKQCLHNKPVHQ
jgi:hypothetical protein